MIPKGIQSINCATLAATLMYRHGNVDVRVLQEILGHESVATTEIYTHVNSERLKTALESNPLSEITLKMRNLKNI